MSFDDHFHEECGVFGIYNAKDASSYVALGLHALQHRGQEACGIVSYDGEQFHAHRGTGHVDKNFGEAQGAILNALKGHAAIGHNRYSTTGDSMLRNVQPLFADLDDGGVAIAHNGNLTNAKILRQKLVKNGSLFQSTSDTEVILHLLSAASGQIVTRLTRALHAVEGAYSLVALTKKKMIGVRDPFGVRPLVLGKKDDAYILASESCALDIIGAELIRDVAPGEMIVIDKNGLNPSLFPFRKRVDDAVYRGHFCIFEHVYFARPDSSFYGRSVYQSRIHIGEELAREHPIEADIVVPVPDSGVPSAIGYASQSGLPFHYGIIRNHYVGRTFIEPTTEIRHLGVKMKHNANRFIVEGKRVILVDDSVVRGTTSKKIVEMMRHAGAKEVHLRIASPPTKHSCFYGVDTPRQQDLLAHENNLKEMCEAIKCDTLGFVSLDGLYRAVGEAGGRPKNDLKRGFCDACFSGDYPIRRLDHERADDKQPKTKQESLLRVHD